MAHPPGRQCADPVPSGACPVRCGRDTRPSEAARQPTCPGPSGTSGPVARLATGAGLFAHGPRRTGGGQDRGDGGRGPSGPAGANGDAGGTDLRTPRQPRSPPPLAQPCRPIMLKHRGFPGRYPGTDYQFTLRRANPKGATAIVARERYRDRKPADREADLGFMMALWDHFGEEPFERGNLDAGGSPGSSGGRSWQRRIPLIRRITTRCFGSMWRSRGRASRTCSRIERSRTCDRPGFGKVARRGYLSLKRREK